MSRINRQQYEASPMPEEDKEAGPDGMDPNANYENSEADMPGGIQELIDRDNYNSDRRRDSEEQSRNPSPPPVRRRPRGQRQRRSNNDGDNPQPRTPRQLIF